MLVSISKKSPRLLTRIGRTVLQSIHCGSSRAGRMRSRGTPSRVDRLRFGRGTKVRRGPSSALRSARDDNACPPVGLLFIAINPALARIRKVCLRKMRVAKSRRRQPRKRARSPAGALECFLCVPTAARAITRSTTRKGSGFARTAANPTILIRVRFPESADGRTRTGTGR